MSVDDRISLSTITARTTRWMTREEADVVLDIARAALALEEERRCLSRRQSCDCGCFQAARKAAPALLEALKKVKA